MELKETGEAIGCIGYYDHAESNIRIWSPAASLSATTVTSKRYRKSDVFQELT